MDFAGLGGSDIVLSHSILQYNPVQKVIKSSLFLQTSALLLKYNIGVSVFLNITTTDYNCIFYLHCVVCPQVSQWFSDLINE